MEYRDTSETAGVMGSVGTQRGSRPEEGSNVTYAWAYMQSIRDR